MSYTEVWQGYSSWRYSSGKLFVWFISRVQEISDKNMWATWYFTKYRKIQIQCRALYASVLAPGQKHMWFPVFSAPHQREVAKHMSEGEGREDGAGAPLEPCCEAINYIDLCIHCDAPVLPQQGALCHTKGGSDYIGGPRRRIFLAFVRKGMVKSIIGSRIHRGVWIHSAEWWSRPVQRRGGWRYSPAYPLFWYLWCYCHQRWHF